jgi:hypothetical protein
LGGRVIPPEGLAGGRCVGHHKNGARYSEVTKDWQRVVEDPCVSVVKGDRGSLPHGLPRADSLDQLAQGYDPVVGSQPIHLPTKSVDWHVQPLLPNIAVRRDHVVVAQHHAGVPNDPGKPG